MPVEIERKFLVTDTAWRSAADSGTALKQGYIPAQGATVRVRIAGTRGFITIKGKTIGLSRSEYEYEIPFADAREMLCALCRQPVISKVRYRVPYKGHIWEIDVFEDANEGLIVAEIELGSPEESFALPPWIGTEVTQDSRYRNSRLAEHPFTQW